MNIDQDERLRLLTEGIAFAISETLIKTGNNSIVFSLIMHDQNLTQCISNTKRESAKELVQYILDNWDTGLNENVVISRPDSSQSIN